MEYEKLKSAAEAITMSEEMKRRIVRNCKTQITISRKELFMKSNKNHTFFRRPATALLALVICISLAVTAVAASGVLKGHFRDIKNWQGAVVGTSYEQATDEIGMTVTVNGDRLTALATFTDPQMIPYKYIENLGIAAFQIVDANGRVVKEAAAESAAVANGQASIHIRLDDIDSGSYTLIVTAFVAEKKPEQPMNLNGHWECDFSK